MKICLFEMFMAFVETSLAQLKQGKPVSLSNKTASASSELAQDDPSLFIKQADDTSLRILLPCELIKLTKASYQFLMQIVRWQVISPENLEVIIHQLSESDSRFVTLQETKWTVRKILAKTLDKNQVAFLDLVLYHKEDNVSLH